jgi:hypothetical protein
MRKRGYLEEGLVARQLLLPRKHARVSVHLLHDFCYAHVAQVELHFFAILCRQVC